MSRVTMHYEDESKIDFASVGDAVFHAVRQSANGVTGLKDEDDKSVLTRKQLDALVRRAAEDGLSDPKDIAKLTEESHNG